MKYLPFFRLSLHLALSDQLAEASPGQINVGLIGFPCSLLKRMKHVDCLAELCYVKNAVFDSRVNPDFGDPQANACHRLPIGWLQPLLDKAKMLPCEPSRIFRKRPDVIERGSGPDNGFFGHNAIYKTLYVLSIVA
jgi:hypothetical protein